MIIYCQTDGCNRHPHTYLNGIYYCKMHIDVVDGFASQWCVEHAKIINDIRSHIDHSGSQDEIEHRLAELKIRKDADSGHQFWYVTSYLTSLDTQ